ncbi:hypothetical protein OL239_06545 [Arthrobacter sp. ATA002]|uniref:hypothetical protein n=1 Tax=Arthrobacter sp. ATA002 TaxID=2991715 RepID=UPI0022A67997|nr:hypothetical protein [Arthrobacter sp. ATA002]WAP52823.1 hypothetical protein OL239_06545 [Arthrobacter sp. ATA002]
MRNKIAVPLIVIGVLLMLVGIGQRTFWAPPGTVTAEAPSTDQQAPLTVIGTDVLTAHPDGVELTLASEGAFLMAVGRTGDVEAWVGDAAVLRVTADGDNLASEVTEGTPTVPNPAGSDLWVSEQEVDGETTFTWDAPASGDWEILLAADGTAPAPANVSVTYANDASTPFAVPLIVGGALLAVLGLALAFAAGRGNSGRRSGGGGPSAESPARRADTVAGPATGSTTTGSTTPPAAEPAPAAGSKPGTSGTSAYSAMPVRRRRGPAAALGTALATVLAFGAGPAPALAALPLTAAPTAEATGEATPPVVLKTQLERILADVAATVQAADAAKDPALLAERAGGSAATLREAGYATSAKVPTHPAPEPIAAEPLKTDLIMGGTEFPRSVVAVTQGPDNEVPQALLLEQASARENYKLVSSIRMLPGTTFPPRPAGGAGVEPAPADSAEGLTTSPQIAVQALADALTNPDGMNKGTFSPNTFADAVTKFQSDVTTSPDNEFADITFDHAAVPDNTRALRTADGGAIVFGYMDSSYTSVPKEAGDSINLEGTVYQTLTGETSTEAGIDVKYGEGVMLYVPPAGSTDQIQVIGAVQELLSATLK